MVQVVVIAIAAGAASALLFASVASGLLISIPLFYLAPLPILIAALGWSHLAGLLAALVAAGSLAVALGAFFFAAFLLGVGLPAWWLGYLALLARPSGGAPDQLEWYPPGRLVLWAAILATLVVAVAIPNLGTDAEGFQAGLKRAFERMLRTQSGTADDAPLQLPGVSEPDRLIDFLVMVIPPSAGVLATLTNVLNLWLAGRIVRISGRLKRPWPDLSALKFPRSGLWLMAAALAGTFLPGLIGLIAVVLSASLLMAYAVLGFAVLHGLTRGMNARGVVLAGIYFAVAVFGWPMLLMSMLGLADTGFDLRNRFANKRGPPSAPP